MVKKDISCIIIDDEPLSVSLLQSYTDRCADTVLVQYFTNPIEGLKFLESQQPDLIFLDVQMPELSGIQFIKIAQRKPLIVLTTAYPEYAVNAFDLDAVDYLLKPISYDRFLRSIEKVKIRFYAQDKKTETEDHADHIFVKSEYKQIKIHFKDILFLEGLRDYIAIHTKTSKILTLQSMKSLEQILPENFTRVHKSYIVNTDEITSLNGSILSLGQLKIPIGPVYARNIKHWIR